LLVAGLLLGAKPQESGGPVAGGDREEVELFAAIEAGQLEAKLILQDEFRGKVLLRNKTGKPLSVRLPEVMAGVPVLAQNVGNGNGFGPGIGQGNGQANSGQPQAVGGGVNGGNQNGQNGALFNVPAERVAQLNFNSVCLEHGKVAPRAVMKYRLVPLSEVNSEPALGDVLTSYLRGHCTQEAAQAAAWHLASEMSWDELAALQIRRATGMRSPYFSAAGLREARRLAEQSQPRSVGSPGDVPKL
jgi:hypothetical protein